MITEDIFFVEEFSDYRLLEVEKGSNILRQLMSEKVSPEVFKGAMIMLKGIINIPCDIAKTEKTKERAELLKVQMMAQFEAKMMRKVIMIDEE